MKKIPLHLQIIFALIFGALFGAFFSVDSDKLVIKVKENGKVKEIIVENWDRIEFLNNDIHIQSFDSQSQSSIIKFFELKTRKEKNNLTLIVQKNDKTQLIATILSINKESTPATFIRPIGDLFIRLLSFLAIPLVIASLIVGAASLSNIRKLGRIGSKTFALYILTTTIAISLGLLIANVVQPGNRIDSETKAQLISDYQDDTPENVLDKLEIDLMDFIVGIVPKNPFNALGSGNMLQIVFFAVIFGITLTLIDKEKRDLVVNFFDGVSDTMIKMVDIIMKIAPYGVFALIAATIADFGFNILSTLVWYCLAVFIGLLIQTYLVYGSIVKIFSKITLKQFFSDIRNAQAIGFSTSSSAATLPITIDCVENKMGIKKEISGFVLPLGATINMDGTALYQGVAAIFIAQVYGFDLNIAEQLTIVLTAVLASIGTSPVPGVGIIMLVMILNAINVPAEGIALILGVDRILDMMRTITNVTGDAAVTVAIAGTER